MLWQRESIRRALAARRPCRGSVASGFDVIPLDDAPAIALRPDPARPPRVAAVLAVLCLQAPEPFVLLTRRADHLGQHAGQVSLPGGHPETHDRDLEATALRETEEELGVASDCLEVVGSLEAVFIPPTNFLVTPFIALAGQLAPLRPDAREVAEVIEFPLAKLFTPLAVERERWLVRGFPYEVPFYRCGEHKIWGATARILEALGRALPNPER